MAQAGRALAGQSQTCALCALLRGWAGNPNAYVSIPYMANNTRELLCAVTHQGQARASCRMLRRS